MTKEEIELITKAFHQNNTIASSGYVATIATIVDILRGDIKGVQSHLANLAQHHNPVPDSSQAEDEDPNPIATEVVKRLGALGMQSLTELKGYKLDDSNRVLLFINGRYADSGWVAPDPHLDELMVIMNGAGLSFSVLP